MIKLIKELYKMLTPSQKKSLYLLQIMIVFMAIFEVIGIASIGPFMAVVGDNTLIQSNAKLLALYEFSGVQNNNEFLIFLGVCVLALLTVASLFSIFTIWRLAMFGSRLGAEISDRLFGFYLKQDWMFHAMGSSANLTKQINSEASRLSNGVIQPLLQISARLFLVVIIVTAIFLFNPIVAIIGFSIFAGAYLIIYTLVRSELFENGRTISRLATARFKLLNEGFGGIKDTLLLGRQKDFVDRFDDTSAILAKVQGQNKTLEQVPRYIIELITYGALISLILSLIIADGGNLSTILPVLAIYALAGFKMLPATQQIYVGFAQIKANVSALDSIKDDLIASQGNTQQLSQLSIRKMTFKNQIELKEVSFAYPGKPAPVLNGLNLTIKANSIVGVVGPSGSGKSTTIDIILGLINPQQGQLLIDGTPINQENKRAWQNAIGYVPQSIFLTEGTIAENIAFGISTSEINYDQVKKAITLAHLDEMVAELADGIHAKVGERGVQLSGGQRQRIGIARALYHEADVLIFDEATSALDGLTEKMIMDAIHGFNGTKTIIMIAHRLKTVEKCDTIFMIEQGQLVASGTYAELIDTNAVFKRMASHA